MWFDFLARNGSEYISAYVAENGKIVTASCRPGSAKVRPSGANDAYPPNVTSGVPGGFTVELDLGSAGILNVNVTVETVLVDGGTLYSRFAGSMVGSINGGPVIKGGIALFEQFNLME